jgi:hypothetical protein
LRNGWRLKSGFVDKTHKLEKGRRLQSKEPPKRPLETLNSKLGLLKSRRNGAEIRQKLGRPTKKKLMKLPESLGRRLFLIGFKQAQYITHAAWAAAEPQRQIHFLPLLNQPLLRVDLLRPLPLELWRLLNPLLWWPLRLRPLQLRRLNPLLWWPLRAVQLPLEAGLVKHKALGLLPLLLPLRRLL